MSSFKDRENCNSAQRSLAMPLSRRSFLQYASAAGVGGLWAGSAWGALFGFDAPFDIVSPLDAYPNRDWEQNYRDLYRYDSTFHFLCAPNDTHNCLLTAYVKNDTVVRIGPSFGFGKAKDIYGNQPSHRWDPRCCQKGLALTQRIYGDRRVKAPMVRTGFKAWADAGFPRDPVTGKVDPQYLRRGLDPYVKVEWEEAFDLSAKALKNIAETYDGPEGKARLLAQGYDEAMVEAMGGAGVQTLKFRGGMPALGATRILAHYRLANMLALLDDHVRGAPQEEAVGGRVWDSYSWHTDLPPGHPMVVGHQTSEFDLSVVEHAKLVLVWGMNWITTKMPDSHWLTEAKLKGTKVIVIAAEYSATACKGDEVLVVRPGTTPALALGFAHVLFRDKLFNEEFVRQFTDLPMLIRDDTHELLRASDVFPDHPLADLSRTMTVLPDGQKPPTPLKQGTSYASETLRAEWGDHVMYDTNTRTFKAVNRDQIGAEFSKLGLVPAIEGAFDVNLVNGETVKVRPVFDHLQALVLKNYTPEIVSEITWAPAPAIESIAQQIAQHGGETLFALGMGPNQFFNSDLKDRAVFLVAAMTGSIGQPGANVGSFAGNYRSAFFSGARYYITEDPFNIAQTPDAPVNYRGCYRGESAHFWNSGDVVLRMGKELLTGKTHMPTPTKSVMVSNSNSLIGNAKGHYALVANTLPKCDFIGVSEWWWTASCEHADIVYAVDSWAEFKYPDATISVTNPFLYIFPDTPLARVHNSRPDLEVAAGVGEALGRLLDDQRCMDYWKFVRQDGSRTYLKRILENSNCSAGYDVDKLIEDARNGIPAPILSRTYPKYSNFEQIQENKPFYTKTGRMEFYREEKEFRDAGENMPIHREPVDSTFYEPSVIVSGPHPLLRPKGPEAYGVDQDDMGADTVQGRHVAKPWDEVKLTKHPLNAEGYDLVFHTPKYRHGAHTMGVDTDLCAVWFGPFTDMYRRDKRMPFINEGYVDMNPQDAKALGLEDGDYVYIDADPRTRPYRGWKKDDEFYKVARLMARCRYYAGTPRGVTRMWYNMFGASQGSVRAARLRPDGLAKSASTGYQAMFRSGSHQSCTRGYLKPTWLTDSLVRKDVVGHSIGKGFALDVHCAVGAPRESIVRITKAEDGGYGGEALWRPARNGLRPTYESDAVKTYIQGGYVSV